jgi:hypothetical protein
MQQNVIRTRPNIKRYQLYLTISVVPNFQV